MAGRNKHTLEKGDKLPPRGKNKRTLILDAIIEKGLVGVSKDATRTEAEKAVFSFMASAAFNPTKDEASISKECLNHLMNKGWASVKPSMESVDFELDENASKSVQASQIMHAISTGDLPPDVGATLINSMANMLKIIEITELEDRIKALEAKQDER